jgi:DNA-binding PucR family transcriptional regulator
MSGQSTLAAWYEEDGSRAAVAQRLHVHRNSVGYRIGRVRELLGIDPLEPWTALQLRCALEARRVLAALAHLGRA